MALADKVINENGHALMRDFGAFYPTGHMVVAFREQVDAQRVLRSLQGLGAAFEGSFYLSALQMTKLAEQNLAEAGIIANLGTSLTTLQSFLDAAKGGASFLILTVPDDHITEQAMQAIRKVPFLLAERYHLLAIETMK
jgi:hypothetical protein